MNLEQLKKAQAQKVTLKHPKKPDSSYIILGFGKMKLDGGVWRDSVTYMDVKSKDSFTREVTGMGNFTAPKLK